MRDVFILYTLALCTTFLTGLGLGVWIVLRFFEVNREKEEKGE